MLEYFKLGVESFNLPSRVRVDRGMENVDVANHKIASHGPDRGSFIVGRSVHNQRIERFWDESNMGLLPTSSKHCSETWS